MPTKPKTSCKYPGCSVLIDIGEVYCEKHKPRRASAAERGYNQSWQKARAVFLQAHPLCEEETPLRTFVSYFSGNIDLPNLRNRWPLETSCGCKGNTPLLFLNCVIKMRLMFNKKKNLALFINETSTAWRGTAYANDIFRAGVDTIARHAAKMRGVCSDKQIERLLSVRPNPVMSSYDFLYKVVTQLYTYGNAFIFWDGEALYPVDYSSVRMIDEDFAEFTLRDGSNAIFSYAELIHLRRFFNEDRLLGGDNTPINSALELAETENEAMTAGVKAGANIRGILKLTEILNDRDLEKVKNSFVQNYLNSSNSVIPLDMRMEYQPISSTPVLINAEQSKAIRDKIYSFLGINEKIVSGEYDENEALAFQESVIEPLAIQMGLEFTEKLGVEVVFSMARLQFISPRTKAEFLRYVMPYGLLSINQALDILNLPHVEGGDTRLQSLNFISADKAEEYQLESKR